MALRKLSTIVLPTLVGNPPHTTFLGALLTALRQLLDTLIEARTLSVGNISLATGVATTTDIVDPTITTDSYVGLEALDVNASAEIGNGNLFITYPSAGTARINHTASALTRAFRYVVVASFLLLAIRADAQVIQDDGVDMEVRSCLDLGTTCTNHADSTSCKL